MSGVIACNREKQPCAIFKLSGVKERTREKQPCGCDVLFEECQGLKHIAKKQPCGCGVFLRVLGVRDVAERNSLVHFLKNIVRG